MNNKYVLYFHNQPHHEAVVKVIIMKVSSLIYVDIITQGKVNIVDK